jgi:LPS O-antigen subunit length determinant protein (WzzB/FepE family)
MFSKKTLIIAFGIFVLIAAVIIFVILRQKGQEKQASIITAPISISPTINEFQDQSTPITTDMFQ